jgi:hypothetical protein
MLRRTEQPMATPHGHSNAHGREPDRSRVERDAIAVAVRLLGDQTLHVMQAAREQLHLFGESARPALMTAARDGDVPTRLRARALLRQLDVAIHLQQFAALELDTDPRRAPETLLAGAVLASQMVRTFVPPASELRRVLHAEADSLRASFRDRSLPTCTRLLSERLTALGFRGADAAPPDLDHVLLDRVVEHRVGSPLSLSLVFLLVGRWAGLTITGVGMPDHFLVRLHGSRPVLLDPFHGGRSITKADCVRYLRTMGYGRVREHLRDLTDRELLSHYLRDLRRAAGCRGRPEAVRALDDALSRLTARSA